MPRRPRIELAGGVHHVTNRGNLKQPVFLDEEDRKIFWRRLHDVANRHGWRWLSFCFMTNHVHLVLETPEATLGVGMRDLLGHYARCFNDRHDRVGHVFQGRFHSKLVQTDAQFAQLLRYVALNPVKKHLCAGPTDWRWSSHRLHIGRAPEAAAARSRTEQLLEPWGGAVGTRYERLFGPSSPFAHLGDRSPWEPMRTLESFLVAGGSPAAVAAAHDHGYSQAQIADALGVHRSTVSRILRSACTHGA